jgi:hypothetical protein
MPDEPRVHRLTNLASEATRVRQQLRLAKEAAATLLSEPKPDTFLGRRTQEPFPQAEE